MKRVLRTTMMALLVMMLLVGMMAPAAMAYGTISKDLTVTVNMKSSHDGGDIPESDKVPVTVTPIGDTAGEVQNLVANCDGSIGKGTVNVTFGGYSKPGIHKYGVTIGLSNQKDRVINDSEKHYVVIITVTNADSESGLETHVAIRDAKYENGAYEYDENATPKPGALEAEKEYAATRKITVSKRWPDGGSRPVTVMLYEVVESGEDTNGDGVVNAKDERVEIDRVTLTNAMNWQHTFEGLDTRKDYILDEVDLAKFHESYKYDKSNDLHWNVTITNTKSLYQTGQLNWPIPFLVCFGSMFMLAGVVLLRKKEEETNE